VQGNNVHQGLVGGDEIVSKVRVDGVHSKVH
jgi:hypothetical protein